MKFDELNNEPCVLPQVETVSCKSDPQPYQEGRLELRPSVAVVGVLGTVQYRTFLIANGIEMEVTSGLTYKSASTAIALIGAIGGNATGVAEGIVTISVEWQGLEAFAQLQVVVSCNNINNGLMVVIDNSESMSQPFGFGYGTKLDFAKFLAKQFVGEANVTKDTVGLVTFAVSAQVVAALTSDNAAVATAIMGVGYVPEMTDISAGLQTAITALTAAGVDRRVILLITDGQHTDDDEPLQIANQFKSQGGVIIAIGLRSGMGAFKRLEEIANGGFFASAYDAVTAEDAKGYVSGLKGYLCAGNCSPEGDVFVGTGDLNFDDFLNWDVVSGYVDLIGNGLFDLLPGHGLYVDLVGSTAPWVGFIQTKQTFTFLAGKTYRLSYKLAGNQRANATPFVVRVIAGGLLNTTRTMNDWRQDFTQYTNEFVGNGTTGKIGFLQETVPASGAQSFGILLDVVQLDNVTDGTMMFMDSFDTENLTYVPPACGAGTEYGFGTGGYGYAYGTSCYGYGCLAVPVKAQAHDPNPPADNEMPHGDPFWVSTQSYTASCPVGTTGEDVTRSATYKSFVSAADANAKALQLAQAAAEAALSCISPPAPGGLINVDFVEAFGQPTLKVGMSATGLSAEDFWNTAEGINAVLKSSTGVDTMSYWRRLLVFGYPNPDGTSTGVNFPFNFFFENNDVMYENGISFGNDAGTSNKNVAYAVHGLEQGTYAVYVYAHDGAPTATGRSNVRTGALLGNPLAGFTWNNSVETNYGEKETEPSSLHLTDAWRDGLQFVKYTVTVGPGQDTILIQIIGSTGAGHENAAYINGLQIQRLT